MGSVRPYIYYVDLARLSGYLEVWRFGIRVSQHTDIQHGLAVSLMLEKERFEIDNCGTSLGDDIAHNINIDSGALSSFIRFTNQGQVQICSVCV